MNRLVLGLFLALLTALPTFAQEPSAGEKVYKQAIPSVVWIHSTRANGLATGSGSLIDAERRLVLTNFHVVDNNPKVTVFFPQFRDGKPIPERDYYRDRAARLAFRGTVVTVDKQADLAIIRLDKLPEGVKAIPLAALSPDQGAPVHSIGNPGKSGALWGYVTGSVRSVYKHKWKARLEANRVVTFEARVIETNSATNPGDSGGPLLNDQSELVGVTQGAAVEAQLVSTFIDVSEVKQVLQSRAVREIKAEKPVEPPKAPTVADEAKLFSAEATAKANEAVETLHKKAFELKVETHLKAPAEWAEKARAATPEERQKLFREWAQGRLQKQSGSGALVLICLDPRYVIVEIDEEVRKKLPDKFAQTVADGVIKELRDKKNDDALSGAVARFRDALTEVKK